MSELEMETNSSPFILMEGILEKLKEREFPWIFSGKKFSTVWVVRYYVLRYANISDEESFLLEQHEDCMPFSKVQKTLDLRRVLQVDSNISLKIGNQNWILAIHYKTKRGEKLKILYLAAHSEAEMNIWNMKLSYARKLQKQDNKNRQLFPVTTQSNIDESGNKFTVAVCMNNHNFTDSSVVESPILSNIITNNGSCVDVMTAHAYIRLKDCSSTHSLGSSSASLSSSIASSSALSENLASKNSFLIPPPIPPRPSHGSRIQESGKRVFESNVHQKSSSPDIKREEWNNETFHLDAVSSVSTDKTFLSFSSSLTPTASDASAPKPLPRRHNFRIIPPEIDRSCKPTGIKYIVVNVDQKKSSTDDWKSKAFAASPRFLPTNASHQQFLHPVVLRNKQISLNQSTLYDNESMRTKNGTLDYLDPAREPLGQPHPFVKSLQRLKIPCATEYTQIDEESTKAVLKANVRQNEIRRNRFPV